MVLQLLATGAAMGFVYCLVAIEYSLIWNSCQLLNFAHTQLIMLGAYIFGGTFVLGLGASYLLGAAGALAVMAVVSLLLAALVFIPPQGCAAPVRHHRHADGRHDHYRVLQLPLGLLPAVPHRLPLRRGAHRQCGARARVSLHRGRGHRRHRRAHPAL